MSSILSSKISKNNALVKQEIPVQLIERSSFDNTNTYAYMRERFNQEMKRINQEMLKFSSDLTQCYGGASTESSIWEAVINSPLVVGEGEDKILKLQFDLSHFDPSEIKVKVMDNMLYITATHDEKSNDRTVYYEYVRQFKLPPGTDPEQVLSSLSRDGVLTVQAPLPLPDTNSYTASDEC